MSSLQDIWAFFLNPENRATLGWLLTGVAAVAAAVWKIYTHFFKKPAPEPTPSQVISIGGGITADRGSTVTIEQKIQTTPEKTLKDLLSKQDEMLAELRQSSPEQRANLERELAVIKTKFESLQQAYEEQKAKLAEAYQALEQEDFKREFAPEQMEKAKEALAQGDTQAAETLFQQALDKGVAEAAEAAYQLGVLAESRIDILKAKEYYSKAVQLQPDNPRYLNALGNLQIKLGHYQEAQLYLKKALQIGEKTLGPEDLEVAASLSFLALLYQTQEKYIEVEPLLQRALRIREKILGPEDPEIGGNLNNLAMFYLSQRKYAEAKPLFQRALNISEKAQGPDNPNVATCLNNLALLYHAQRKYEEAEPLFQRSREILEKSLGPDNPQVIIILRNYAILLREMGRKAEAAQLEAQAQAIREKYQIADPNF